jgi:hypothetical protein
LGKTGQNNVVTKIELISSEIPEIGPTNAQRRLLAPQPKRVVNLPKTNALGRWLGEFDVSDRGMTPCLSQNR